MSFYNIYIKDILEMINRIEGSMRNRVLNFKEDIDLYDLMLLRLQVIGETIKKLPVEKRKNYPEVNWNIFIHFRNIVSHNYFTINHNALRKVILVELPKLKKAIRGMKFK